MVKVSRYSIIDSNNLPLIAFPTFVGPTEAEDEKNSWHNWICNDVWMDILPHFDRPQLGLTLALLSYRFDALVDTHFGGKSELEISRTIIIREDIGMPKLFVEGKSEGFPLPDYALPDKIHFNDLRIYSIDQTVITFLRSNQQIWDRGTELAFKVSSDGADKQQQQPIWDVFVRDIWPLFATNICHLGFPNADHLDNLLRLVSPTILTDSNNMNSIQSDYLCPEVLADEFDRPNATSAVGQALSKWLHTPTTDGQLKWLQCFDCLDPPNIEWINNFRKVFVCARTSVSYIIRFTNYPMPVQIEPFELENERTMEKLTLMPVANDADEIWWLLKRCSMVEETAAVQQKWAPDKLNNVFFDLSGDSNFIGPLFSPSAAAKEASQSSENGV